MNMYRPFDMMYGHCEHNDIQVYLVNK